MWDVASAWLYYSNAYLSGILKILEKQYDRTNEKFNDSEVSSGGPLNFGLGKVPFCRGHHSIE